MAYATDPAEAIENVCDKRHEAIMAVKVAEGMTLAEAELYAASRIVIYLDRVAEVWKNSPRMTRMITAMRDAYAYPIGQSLAALA